MSCRLVFILLSRSTHEIRKTSSNFKTFYGSELEFNLQRRCVMLSRHDLSLTKSQVLAFSLSESISRYSVIYSDALNQSSWSALAIQAVHSLQKYSTQVETEADQQTLIDRLIHSSHLESIFVTSWTNRMYLFLWQLEIKLTREAMNDVSTLNFLSETANLAYQHKWSFFKFNHHIYTYRKCATNRVHFYARFRQFSETFNISCW